MEADRSQYDRWEWTSRLSLVSGSTTSSLIFSVAVQVDRLALSLNLCRRVMWNLSRSRDLTAKTAELHRTSAVGRSMSLRHIKSLSDCGTFAVPLTKYGCADSALKTEVQLQRSTVKE